MKLRTAMLLVALALMVAAAARAQEGVLLSADFENGVGGFITLDPEATLGLTADPQAVYGGHGSLELAYFQRAFNPAAVESQLPGAMAMPLQEALPQLAGLSFALFSEVSTPVLLALSEGTGGPTYNRMIWSEAGAWHEFTLGLDEFNHDTSSVADPDGQLTPGEVTGLAIVDAGGFLRYLADTNPMIHADPAAHQTLRLDDLKLLSVGPVRPGQPEGTVLIADYEPPPVGLAMLGGTEVVVGDEEVERGGRALKVDYRAPAGTIVGLLHLVKRGSLAGVRTLKLWLRSAQPAQIVVSVEEKRGEGESEKSNYIMGVPMEGDEPWQQITINVADLTQQGGAPDPDGGLNMEMVETIIVADANAMIYNADMPNTLWLDDFTAEK